MEINCPESIEEGREETIPCMKYKVEDLDLDNTNLFDFVLGYETGLSSSDIFVEEVGIDLFNAVVEAGFPGMYDEVEKSELEDVKSVLHPEEPSIQENMPVESNMQAVEARKESQNKQKPPAAVDLPPEPFKMMRQNQSKIRKQRKNVCKICQQALKSTKLLQLHLVRKHGVRVTPKVIQNAGGGGVFTPKGNVCKDCEKGFKRKNESIAHSALASRIKCIFCSDDFPCVGAWTKHCYTHLAKCDNLFCTLCDSQLSSRYNLMCHYTTHILNLVYRCPFCRDRRGNITSYRTLKGITAHLMKHDENMLNEYNVG
ncbi:zinc finger protein 639-like [Folsomia candida]|uniref:zinc finger protein 639-like n=1 Tax=Folsomia candida TaxID=158441 RepID=UPI001604B9FB|nr:zinc finger protein 639-like [Folsomia candida]